MSIQIALVVEDMYESLLIASALDKKGIEATHFYSKISHLSQLLDTNVPDVLVISIGENALNEIATVEKVRGKHPFIGLVFITSSPDLRLLGLREKNLPLGAQIIFKKSVTDLHIFSRAIHDAADQSKIGATMKWVTGNSFTDETTFVTNLTGLTQVQVETLRLVAQGHSNAQIAVARVVTEKAVEHTITRILTAMNLKPNKRNNSRVMLAREYYRWVEVSQQIS